jgi:uncharacterized RDD family membrane protein YckC
MTSVLQCPKCRLLLPEFTEYCDCGYWFLKTEESLFLDYSPGLLIRFVSTIIDLLVLTVPFVIFELLFKMSSLDSLRDGIGIIYVILMLTVYGQTLGMKACKLFLGTMNGEKPSFSKILVRSCFQIFFVVLGTILSLIMTKLPSYRDSIIIVRFMCSFACPVWIVCQLVSFNRSSDRQWIEDRLAGTRMYLKR